MRILIVSDLRACVQADRILLASQHYYIIKRYREAFGSVTLCARLVHADGGNNWIDATDVVDEVIGLRGLTECLLPGFGRRLQPELAKADMMVARLHSISGLRALAIAGKRGVPTLAEVMGDAWDAFWHHGLTGKLIAPFVWLRTRQMVRRADYALYVTDNWLQKRYPCRGVSIGASNVVIAAPGEAVREKRLQRIADCDWRHITVMTTAAVDVRYKGQEYVIRAIPLLNRRGIRVRYVLAGGGDPAYLKDVAARCGVADQVEFTGRLTADEVIAWLDETDVYIQPSLQEGLPRALIEAMSRGCVCLGARTGGIPELLEEDFVLRRADAADIARILAAIGQMDPAGAALRNMHFAERYLPEKLDERRNAFFSRICAEMTAK